MRRLAQCLAHRIAQFMLRSPGLSFKLFCFLIYKNFKCIQKYAEQHSEPLHIKLTASGIPWWSRGQDLVLSLPWPGFNPCFLVREPRSRSRAVWPKKPKTQNQKNLTASTIISSWPVLFHFSPSSFLSYIILKEISSTLSFHL